MEPAARRLPALSGTGLKLIACASMLLDHIGASCLETGLLAGYYAGTAPAQPFLLALDRVLRLAGRLAFPLYCFLLAEGFCHTRSAGRYLLRLLGFALISEVPFDLAFFGTPLYAPYQNVYFTLALGLLCLMLLHRCEALPAAKRLPAQAAALAACCAAAVLLRTDYDWFGVALIAVLYLLRRDPGRRLAAGCLMTLWEAPAPLAFLPIACYSGRRGRCPGWARYAFYAFYPAHLAVLAAVTLLVLR